MSAQLTFQEKPVASSVDSGAQVQQVINVECVAPFFEAPRITIKFRSEGGSMAHTHTH